MCVYLGIWLFLLAMKKRDGKKYLFFSGLVFSLATLNRPISIFIPVVFVVVIFFFHFHFTKAKLRLMAIFLLGYLLLIIPWQIYATSSAKHFFIIESGASESVKVGLTFIFEPSEKVENPPVSSTMRAYMERIEWEDLGSGGQIVRFFIRELWYEKQILLIQLPYLVLAVFGVFFAIKRYQNTRLSIALLLGIIAYFWAFAIVVLSIMRYMIPAMGLLMAFCAVTIIVLLEKVIKKSPPST